MAQQTDTDLDVFEGLPVGTALVEPVALCDFCNKKLVVDSDVHALVYDDEPMVSWAVCDGHSDSLENDDESFGQWVTATLRVSIQDPHNLRLGNVRELNAE